MNDANTTQQTRLIFRRLDDTLHIFGQELSGYWWLAVLVPVLILALAYVIRMYVKDSRSINRWWAIFLGVLRCSVYALLAFAFLLPGRQTEDVTSSRSRVLVVFDCSRSVVEEKDDLPTSEMPVEKLPTRQDKVIDYLLRESQDPKAREAGNFLKSLEAKNPLICYRFGSQIDEDYLVREGGLHWLKPDWEENQRARDSDQRKPGAKWTVDDWRKWLKPGVRPADGDTPEEVKRKERNSTYFSSTNVGGSVLDVLKREGNAMLQGIIVFSDGRSTEESPQAYRELAEMAQQKKIPIFVVKLGENRPKIDIEIADVRVPELARPDDTFPVSVEVRVKGLNAQTGKVFLDVYAPGEDGKAQLKQVFKTLESEVLFTKQGDYTGAEAKFEISPAEFGEALDLRPNVTPDKDKEKDKAAPPPAADDKKGLVMRPGEWQFVARIAKDQRENFVPKEHVQDPPSLVRIEQRALRVLLFASGPTHEYQFIRTLFVRERDKGRINLSIHVQPAPGQSEPRNGIVADVPPEQLLTRFPDIHQAEQLDTDETRYYNLTNYDLIIAFDPDWNRLSDETKEKVNKWVNAGGGLIVVGGPINTVQLARPGAASTALKWIIDVYPVILRDNRLVDLERPTNEPHRLNFDPKQMTPEMEFLNLDEGTKEGPDGAEAPPKLLAGWEEFFTGRSRDKASEPAPLKNGFYNFYPVDGAKRGANVIATFSDSFGRLKDGSEQPFLVIHPIMGRGKSVWLGAGETRRLRSYREAYHERFWTKLARYVGSGNMAKQNSRVVPYIGKQFPAKSLVHIEAQIAGLDQKPLPSTAKPELTIRLPVGVGDEKEREQKYTLEPKQTPGWFEKKFPVKYPGKNYEYKLFIKETGEVVPGKFDVKEADPEMDNTSPDVKALYFDLASDAQEVLRRVEPAVERELKERLRRPDLGAPKETVEKAEKPEGDKTATPAPEAGMRLYFELGNADLIPRCMATQEKSQTNRGPIEDLWEGRINLFGWDTSWTLLLAVGLLSAEWLTRKLLRLA